MRKNAAVLLLALAFVAVGVVVTNSAFAAPAISFTSPVNAIINVTTLAGWQFTVNNDVTVDALGFYDNPAYGISQSHDVGIYNVTTQTLVVSGVVTPSDPYNNWFNWTSATPTVLTAGQTYDIVAFVGSDNRTWDPNGFTVNPNITYVMDVWTNYATSLTFPESTDSNLNGYFGPNFDIVPSSTVPEPSAILFLLPGLVGLSAMRRRLKK